jgi:hypothetical protein
VGRIGGSVDEAVLAELRAIRMEIQRLAQRVGESAPRAELEHYVRREVFDGHLRDHTMEVEGWRFWGPFVLSGIALLVVLMQAAGIHLAAG